jgi:hypothetical protein
MKWVIGVMILLSATFAFAQTAPNTLWTRTFGGNGDDWANSIQQTSDGGYIIAGGTYSFGAGRDDVYLVKTNSIGDTLWTRTFGGTNWDEAWSVKQTSDGGYIVAGITWSFGAGNRDFYLIKINSFGDAIWTRTYGGTGDDFAFSMDQTSDGGYIIAGCTSSFGAVYYDFYMIKTNSTGDTLWTRRFGGTYWDEFNSVKQTSDGGYIIAGTTSSFGSGSDDFYLMKTNSLGDSLWTRTYGGTNSDEAEEVRQTADSGYVIAGSTWSFGNGSADHYVVKVNDIGNVQWTRTYGFGGFDRANTIKQSIDGGYIIGGNVQPVPTYPSDFYLIKTNSIGDTLWTRIYGGSNEEAILDVECTDDGGYIAAGYTTSFGAGSSDFYVVKTGPEQPPFRVFSPNGGEQWHILQNDTILWIGNGFQGHVRIELNRSYPSSIWEMLRDDTENDGVEAVYITDPLSDRCRIRVSTIGDTLSDISDSNFSIVSSQGYLALILSAQPTLPLISWNAGVMECPNSTMQGFRLKNFGNESIVVFCPETLTGPNFSRQTNCSSYFALAPGEVSACSLTVTYDPMSDGIHYDTLMIMTDAVNQVGGYVRIPLQGQRISTPATPVTVLSLEGNNARLTWEPITESILGCPVTVTAYLIFYSETYAGPYYFLNLTTDTTYVHTWVVRFAPSMFYEVIAITEPLSFLDSLVAGRIYSREEILQLIKN